MLRGFIGKLGDCGGGWEGGGGLGEWVGGWVGGWGRAGCGRERERMREGVG